MKKRFGCVFLHGGVPNLNGNLNGKMIKTIVFWDRLFSDKPWGYMGTYDTPNVYS